MSTTRFDLNLSLGVQLLGILLSSILFGVILIQTYKYYQASFKNDSIFLKSTVGLLCILEILRSIFLWVDIYNRSVVQFGNLFALLEVKWTLVAVLSMSNVIIAIVEAFFIFRLYAVSGIWQYPALLFPVQIARLGFGFGASIITASSTLAEVTLHFRWLLITTFSLGAVTDILTTIALSVCFQKNYSPMLRSQTLSEKVIAWTIETGLLPCLASIITVILIIAQQSNLLWNFFWLQTAPLYGNALLSFLNGRISLRTAKAASHILPVSLGPRACLTNHHNMEVQIGTVETRADHVFQQSDTVQKLISAPPLRNNGNHILIECLEISPP